MRINCVAVTSWNVKPLLYDNEHTQLLARLKKMKERQRRDKSSDESRRFFERVRSSMPVRRIVSVRSHVHWFTPAQAGSEDEIERKLTGARQKPWVQRDDRRH